MKGPRQLGFWNREPYNAEVKHYKAMYEIEKKHAEKLSDNFEALQAEVRTLRAEKAERDRAKAQLEHDAWVGRSAEVGQYNAAIKHEMDAIAHGGATSHDRMVALESIARLRADRDQYISKYAPGVPKSIGPRAVHATNGHMDQAAYEWLIRQGIKPYPGEQWHL